MKITREFGPGDRYVYDFGLCSYENGWAQVDTAQDASYFGTWANPTRLMIFRAPRFLTVFAAIEDLVPPEARGRPSAAGLLRRF